ncbi:hypothetical protein, variant [Saprolegnia diclina VS20]|uniref:Alginate lyase domain-containing protein n=1 Tax=Saprolegnia diclina (strain VS20) TaxID=1156394 RepID=T0RJN8_SAPDV|nr:hypothetical protein, variant [Saprolegnia diclina VS20]EQC30092.1 hypothetical protein, variant [Saprolegnia diclina VS20]|eukprot:XP_008616435.1 hypothetical protein, variant [Saprolegnia diclina VS20]
MQRRCVALLASSVLALGAPTVYLGRVVGNALPPRHDPRRTLQNIEFILRHEVSDPALEKHWVLNRIVDADVAQALLQLLTSYNATYTELPFELATYAETPFRVASEHGKDMVHAAVADMWHMTQIEADVYDAKNLYVMGINAARNHVLALGQRAGATWILPWDQNCFLTPDGWRELRDDLTHYASTDHKYVVTWMDRLRAENDVVFTSDFAPTPWEEPQVSFRYDARATFDDALRYGRRDKAALLVRLLVPGPWWDWDWTDWERRRTSQDVVRDASANVPSSSYVLRLYSGTPSLEEPGSSTQRELTRATSITRMLQHLDAKVLTDVYAFDAKNLALLHDGPVDNDDTGHELVNAAETSLHNLSPSMAPELQLSSIVRGAAQLLLAAQQSGRSAYAARGVALLERWFTSHEIENELGVQGPDTIALLCDSLRLAERRPQFRSRVGGIKAVLYAWYRAHTTSSMPQDDKEASPLVNLQREIHLTALAAYFDDRVTYRYLAGTIQGRLLSMFTRAGAFRQSDALAHGPSLVAWAIAAHVVEPANANIYRFDVAGQIEVRNSSHGWLCRAVEAHSPLLCAHGGYARLAQWTADRALAHCTMRAEAKRHLAACANEPPPALVQWYQRRHV